MTQTPYSPPHVDEHALGPGTNIRFVLLVALLLVATATMTGDASAALTRTTESRVCFFAAGFDPDDADSVASFAHQRRITEAYNEAYEACNARYNALPTPWWAGIAWMALLLVGSAVVFWAIPRWRSRRGRVVALAAIDRDGAIWGAIEDLAATAGLARLPRVVVDPAARSTGAVVYGHTGRPTVCLHGGLIARRQSDPAGFRAVLLHEFAHIRNGDLTLTYATVSMWRVFVGLVLLPYVAFQVIYFPGAPWGPAVPGSVPLAVRSLLLAAVMVALVYLARSDVLRSRELHADLAAVRWGADPTGWAGSGAAQASRVVRRALRALSELWHTHPQWDVRRAALFDPAGLFTTRTMPILLAGIAGTLIHVQLAEVIADAGVPHTAARQVAAVVAAALVTGVVGVVLWRAVAYSVATGSSVPSGIRTGAWLGIGLAVAELVMNHVAATRWLPIEPEHLLVLILVAAVFAWWVSACAHLYLSAWVGRTIRPVMAVALVPASVVLAAALVSWRQWGPLLARGFPLGRLLAPEVAFPAEATARPAETFVITLIEPSLTILLGSVLALPAAVLLWLTPLVVWLIRPEAGVAQWVRTETSARREGLPALRRVLGFAALSGMMCWAVVAATMAYLHTWGPPGSVRSDFYFWAYSAWMIVAVAAALIIAAVATSVATSRHRLPIALVTSGAGALIGLGGVLALTASNGCMQRLSTLNSSCHWLPGPAWGLVRIWTGPVLLLAVVAAIIGVTLGSAVRTLKRTPVRAYAAAPSRGRLLARRLCVIVLCGAAVAVTVASVPSHTGPSADQAPTAAQRLGAPAQPPAEPRTRTFQMIAWVQVGGGELLERIIEEFDRMIAAHKAVAADSWGERSVFEPICTRIAEIAIDAERFFPAPDPQAQAHWEVFISRAKKGGQDCVSSFERHDVNLFHTSTQDLLEAVKTLSLAMTRMNAVLQKNGAQPDDLQ